MTACHYILPQPFQHTVVYLFFCKNGSRLFLSFIGSFYLRISSNIPERILLGFFSDSLGKNRPKKLVQLFIEEFLWLIHQRFLGKFQLVRLDWRLVQNQLQYSMQLSQKVGVGSWHGVDPIRKCIRVHILDQMIYSLLAEDHISNKGEVHQGCDKLVRSLK